MPKWVSPSTYQYRMNFVTTSDQALHWNPTVHERCCVQNNKLPVQKLMLNWSITLFVPLLTFDRPPSQSTTTRYPRPRSPTGEDAWPLLPAHSIISVGFLYSTFPAFWICRGILIKKMRFVPSTSLHCTLCSPIMLRGILVTIASFVCVQSSHLKGQMMWIFSNTNPVCFVLKLQSPPYSEECYWVPLKAQSCDETCEE
jgi:hypothetical protein